MKRQIEHDELLTPGEVMAITGLTRNQLDYRARKGALGFVRTPGRWRRFYAAEVRALAGARKAGTS